MNPANSTTTFIVELNKANGAFEKVHVIDEFRQTMEGLPPKKKSLIAKIKKVFKRSQITAQQAYESALKEQPYGLLLNACQTSYKELIRDILKLNDLDINVCSKVDEQTALHISCLYKRPEISQELLKWNPNPNIQDSKGNTALHYACIAKSPDLAVQLILKAGANPFIKNNKGQHPSKCVKEEHIAHIKKQLKENKSTSALGKLFFAPETRNTRFIIYSYLSVKDIITLRSISRIWRIHVSDDLIQIIKK